VSGQRLAKRSQDDGVQIPVLVVRESFSERRQSLPGLDDDPRRPDVDVEDL